MDYASRKTATLDQLILKISRLSALIWDSAAESTACRNRGLIATEEAVAKFPEAMEGLMESLLSASARIRKREYVEIKEAAAAERQ